MQSDELTKCPGCGQQLVISEGDTVETYRCAACGFHFVRQQATPTKRRFDRLALGSLLLGLFSIVGTFLTGIAAVVLGVMALRRLKWSKERRGKGIAIAGIVLGAGFALTCGPCYLMMANVALSFKQTTDQQEIAQLAAKFVEFAAPEGTEAIEATGFLGMHQFEYKCDPSGATFSIRRIPRDMGQSREIQQPIIADRHPGTLIEQEVWMTEPMQVIRQRCRLGEEDDDREARRYYALVDTDLSLYIVRLTVQPPDEPDDKVVLMTDEQVESFFRSIKIVEGL